MFAVLTYSMGDNVVVGQATKNNPNAAALFGASARNAAAQRHTPHQPAIMTKTVDRRPFCPNEVSYGRRTKKRAGILGGARVRAP